MKPSVIATLATKSALQDLQLLLASLELWNTPAPKVYLACDTETVAALKGITYKGELITVNCLDQYTPYNRQQMEAIPGQKFQTLWFDFMCEKISLLKHAFSLSPDPILFCDADICFFGPLPNIPDEATLALSPHMIRSADEDRYGQFNGGFFWVKDPAHLETWLTACKTSTFYEQKAMEAMCPETVETPTTYFFPKQINYGWWRLFQGSVSPDILAAEWGIHRVKGAASSGIMVLGEPLICIHTHFGDRSNGQFNQFVLQHLKKLAPLHKPAKAMLDLLNRLFPSLRQN